MSEIKCPKCGAPMVDAGQSGSYCQTPRCPNSWYGTLTEAEWDEKHLSPEQREKARRMRASWRDQREGDGTA